MSLREELERAMQAQEHYEATGVMPTWAKMAMVNFLRDHGQALLEALVLLDQLACCTGQDCGCHGVTKREVAENLKDAEDNVADAARYRYVRRKEAWREVQDNPHDGSISAIYVGRGDRGGGNALDTDELDTAIDLARSKTVDGGGA